MRCLILLIFSTLAASSYGQSGSAVGRVISQDAVLPFVKVHIRETGDGTVTDAYGNFKFSQLPEGTYELYMQVIGFEPYSITFTITSGEVTTVNVDLSDKDLELNTVVVTGTMRETMISNSPVKIEVLNKSFFLSNPVNSIIEALETVNGVQEQVNCGVCGTNDIHINGMEGPYTLVLIDGMPIVSGLSSVYGFNGIPTSLIDRVEIVKGPSSTLYGAEAVGGVVNIITKSPEKSDLLNIETRYSTHGELKTELSISPKFGERVFMSLSGDFYYNQYRMDFNNDGFTDIPLNERLSIFNKWQINNKKGQKAFSLGMRYLYEDRFGGQLDWQPIDRGSGVIYGESILTERVELIGSYIFPVKNRNLRLDFSANRHQQDSFYGDVSYTAEQDVYFTNLIFEKKLSPRNYLVSGFSNKYQVYEDNTPSNTNDASYIPGIFAQNEFNWTEDRILLTGVRFDYHEKHGLVFSPRVSFKQTVRDYTNIRFNYGTGFRQVFLFTEDHAFVTGARDVVINGELNPERSHNVTFNLNHTYTAGGYGNLDLDLFYTYFTNKIVPDFDTDPNLIIYDNLSGFGVTRGISFAVNHKFTIPLRIKLGTTFMDVFEKTENEITGEIEKETQVFAPKFSGVFSVSYDLKKVGLKLNYTGKVMGRQRLPQFGEEFGKPDYSDWFTLQNFQITKTFKSKLFSCFVGVKNIFNYTQESPLIDPQNPFGDSFDTSYAYGPLQVRRFYIGFRYGLGRKK
ncbi:MAG: outer membrane receptor for ferrienterochelin and colicins [Crocinitomix sp.]|jgi:outer membrane receptor for ferrienterochelin and colicins